MNLEKHVELAAKRLKEVREASGMSQKDFAAKFGINKSTFCRYENGEIGQMKATVIAQICSEYNINMGWLMGFDEEKYVLTEKAFQQSKRLPVLGSLKPNVSIFAQEDITDYIFVPKTDPSDFCLYAKDSSMSGAGIFEGSIVCIKKQDSATNGDIVLVEFDDEVIIRRLNVLDDGAEVFSKEELGGKGFSGNLLGRILGKVTAFRTEVK